MRWPRAIGDDTFAFDFQFQIAKRVGDDRIVGCDVARANHAAQDNALMFVVRFSLVEKGDARKAPARCKYDPPGERTLALCDLQSATMRNQAENATAKANVAGHAGQGSLKSSEVGSEMNIETHNHRPTVEHERAFQ